MLKAAGIPTAVHYPVPLHRQPAYAKADCPPTSFPQSNLAGERVMSLPMSSDITAIQQERVVRALAEALAMI